MANDLSPAAPVTHALYSAHCTRVAVEHNLSQVYVQVQRKREVFCAQVCDLSNFGGRDWFKVRTPVATGWVPGEQVRLCSQLDGRCLCAETDASEVAF